MTLTRHRWFAVLFVTLLGSAALADDHPDEPAATRASAKRSAPPAGEFVMGFSATLVDPGLYSLSLGDGPAAQVPGLGGLATPLGGGSLITSGPSWEARFTQSHLRFCLGLTKPWALFRQGALDADVPVTGGPLMGSPVRVSPRSLSLWLVRVGLGGEVTFGRVTPFVDLLGDLQWATVEAAVDGQQGTFTSSGFSLSTRAGLRVQLDESLTVGLAGEVGLWGAPRFGASLLAGWRFPFE